MPEARRTKRPRQLLWRWRNNPLRRHDDVVEAWIMLVVWAAIALGGALIGAVTAHATDESLAQLRHDRHTVGAVLAESTARAVSTGDGTRNGHVRAKVRWTASDGSLRSGRALVDSGQKAGSNVLIWVNSKGQVTTEPPTASAAATEAAMFGAGAALAFGGLVFAAGRVAQWRLDQRRYEQWDREWGQVGPQWGRRTT
ncbi:Rv1733c family protein [Streptomyces sp. NBC_00775]|uniref:Rv1733c family protein n=1 Tax=unclassified Streptomyces TaxID=2593676 RepID=UPI003FA6E55A